MLDSKLVFEYMRQQMKWRGLSEDEYVFGFYILQIPGDGTYNVSQDGKQMYYYLCPFDRLFQKSTGDTGTITILGQPGYLKIVNGVIENPLASLSGTTPGAVDLEFGSKMIVTVSGTSGAIQLPFLTVFPKQQNKIV